MTEEFDPVLSASALLAGCRKAAMATLDGDLAPFASLVSIAAEPGRFPSFLLSDLALHTRNVRERRLGSLLLSDEAADGENDPLVRERLTLSGTIEPSAEQQAAKGIFLRYHPYAARYAGFSDFSCYRLVCKKAHLVAGFGRIAGIEAEDLFPGEFE